MTPLVVAKNTHPNASNTEGQAESTCVTRDLGHSAVALCISVISGKRDLSILTLYVFRFSWFVNKKTDLEARGEIDSYAKATQILLIIISVSRNHPIKKENKNPCVCLARQIQLYFSPDVCKIVEGSTFNKSPGGGSVRMWMQTRQPVSRAFCKANSSP